MNIIAGGTYNAGDVINKTLIALKPVPVYSFPGDHELPMGYIEPGTPVGVVYSYLDASPGQDRTTLWWQFGPATNYSKYFYAPHREGLYDVSALREQGVITTKEKAEAAAEANLPWYERLIKRYGIWVVVSVLGAAALKGYFSRPSKQ